MAQSTQTVPVERPKIIRYTLLSVSLLFLMAALAYYVAGYAYSIAESIGATRYTTIELSANLGEQVYVPYSLTDAAEPWIYSDDCDGCTSVNALRPAPTLPKLSGDESSRWSHSWTLYQPAKASNEKFATGRTDHVALDLNEHQYWYIHARKGTIVHVQSKKSNLPFDAEHPAEESALGIAVVEVPFPFIITDLGVGELEFSDSNSLAKTKEAEIISKISKGGWQGGTKYLAQTETEASVLTVEEYSLVVITALGKGKKRGKGVLEVTVEYSQLVTPLPNSKKTKTKCTLSTPCSVLPRTRDANSKSTQGFFAIDIPKDKVQSVKGDGKSLKYVTFTFIPPYRDEIIWKRGVVAIATVLSIIIGGFVFRWFLNPPKDKEE